PSFLAKLGEYLAETGYDTSSVHTLVCIGEPLRTRDLELTPLGRKLDRHFPGAAHSTYASSEIVTSFTECSACAGGHPPADLAVVEIVDPDGHPLPPGKVGEVVVTPLRVTGMPLIRFRTGDVSFLIPEERCSCGRNTRRLGPILGRKAQMLKIRGTTLFPNSFFTVLDSLEDVADYYMEVSGSALSDEVRVFAAVRDPGCTAQFISEQLYKRIRIHVPVEIIPYEDARAKISRQSRKPVRFFDLRTP
ncbi:MAG: phenylacetate--CoA ligase family protein, partial [Lentisphaeria bacterium]|nr:phenylacetate--CoA ligase family protein [Lentisphaeria bacterium]